MQCLGCAAAISTGQDALARRERSPDCIDDTRELALEAAETLECTPCLRKAKSNALITAPDKDWHPTSLGTLNNADPTLRAAPLIVAVTGSSGLVGRALCGALVHAGHRVIRLVRKTSSLEPDEVRWSTTKTFDANSLEGIDALVHLAGENIAAGRWTAARKRAIAASRIDGTRRLCEAVAQLARPPRVIVSASGVGYYGDRALPIVDESAPAGEGFLASVCQEWEAALEPASHRGIRTVSLRIGVVVSRNGGLVARLRVPFQLGLGGRVGRGTQGMSWIQLEDLIEVIRFALDHSELHGAVNAVAPNPVTQFEFARALARALHRPCAVPMPAWIVRVLCGEMGRELLLGGQWVVSSRLSAYGFRFSCERIEDALRLAVADPR